MEESKYDGMCMSIVKAVLKRTFGISWVPPCYWLINDLLKSQPRYDSGWRYIPEWIPLLKSLEIKGKEPSSRILVFSSTMQWNNFSLALSSVLAAKNIQVDYFWTLHPHILPDTSQVAGYKHWIKSANKVKEIVNSTSRLHVESLHDISPQAPTGQMEEIAHKQALIDASYLLRKEVVTAGAGSADQKVIDLRYNQNLDTILRLSTVLKAKSYDQIITPNGMALDFGAVYAYARTLDIPVSTIEFWDIRRRVVVSSSKPVVGINTDTLWASDHPHLLTLEKRNRVQTVINDRLQPFSKKLTIKYQTVKLQARGKVQKDLELNPNLPTVLLCPNVPFDSIFYVERNKNFATMGQWLIETTQYFASKPKCQLIIRSHPAESLLKTNETTANIINGVFSNLPNNIKLLPPGAPFNTYSLMAAADMGLVYASTTGLEMAMRGIPTVCGISNQHYNNKGFTIDPDSPDEYFDEIERLLTNIKDSRLSDRQIELAWCYADIFFNRWTKSFPWHAETLRRDMKTWPLSRMLSEEGAAKYGNVIGALLGEQCD